MMFASALLPLLAASSALVFQCVHAHRSARSAHGQSGASQVHKCAEKALAEVCECDHWSGKIRGYQCSGCKDKQFYGYGCDMPCSPDCQDGCDFSGNCLPPPLLGKSHKNCKRMSRTKDRISKDNVYNSFGYCQACKDGYFGKHCEEGCPKNCKRSQHEGTCTRGGSCYHCEDGWYGAKCEDPCPGNCHVCVMKDNMVADPETGAYMAAGTCEKCEGDHYGEKCEETCPENCEKPKRTFFRKEHPSCQKHDGKCLRCEGDKFRGEKCDKECPSNCLGETCTQHGKCNRGCTKGTWGDTCQNECNSHCKDGRCDKTDGSCVYIPHD